MDKELLKRFFDKKCTAAETAEVIKYLRTHPELVEEYLNEGEWQEAAKNIADESFWQENWALIQNRKRKDTVTSHVKKLAAAACIAGLFIAGYNYFTPARGGSMAVTSNKTALAAVAAAEVKTINNTGDTAIKMVLQDNSVVTISPHSSIQFTIPFQNNKRDIQLQGEARFSVTKDKTRPFTVFAGGLSTMALGTEFKITEVQGIQRKVTVKLFTGRVVIKRIDTSLKGWNKDVYLQAGEQVRYDAENMVATIAKITQSVQSTSANTRYKTREPNMDGGLAFNDNALPDVMEKLSKYYHIKINYNKAEIQDMNFTGTVSKKDPLEMVLKIITQMNGLNVTVANDAFIVRKENR